MIYYVAFLVLFSFVNLSCGSCDGSIFTQSLTGESITISETLSYISVLNVELSSLKKDGPLPHDFRIDLSVMEKFSIPHQIRIYLRMILLTTNLVRQTCRIKNVLILVAQMRKSFEFPETDSAQQIIKSDLQTIESEIRYIKSEFIHLKKFLEISQINITSLFVEPLF